jgi:hypothetical protein
MNVGDRVKILSASLFHGELWMQSIGKTGKIISFNSLAPSLVRVAINSKHLTFRRSDLQLIRKEPLKLKQFSAWK